MQGEELARLVEQLSAEPELDYTLDQVVAQARVNVPGCESCAVSLRRNGTIEHATATDLAAEKRWPRWASAARAAGIGSSLTLLLPVDGRSATLSLYSRRPSAFDQTSLDVAAVYARLSGVAVQHAYHSVGLRTAMQSRLSIGVAQGILMQRYGISLDRAFEVLRRRSNETNTKLRDVALAVVWQADPRAFEHGPREVRSVRASAGSDAGAAAVTATPATVRATQS